MSFFRERFLVDQKKNSRKKPKKLSPYRRPHFRLGQRVLLVLAVPKVADLQERPRPAVQQRVLELDVPVHDAHAVTVVKADDQLLEEPARVGLVETPAGLDVLEHVPSGGELHDDGEEL